MTHQYSDEIPKSHNGLPYITSDITGTVFISFRFCHHWWQMRCPKSSGAWYFRREDSMPPLWKPVMSGTEHVCGMTPFRAQELLKYQILLAVHYGKETSSHINE